MNNIQPSSYRTPSPPPPQEPHIEILTIFQNHIALQEKIHDLLVNEPVMVSSVFGLIPKLFLIKQLRAEQKFLKDSYLEKLHDYLQSGKNRDLLAETLSPDDRILQLNLVRFWNSKSPN